MDRGAWWAIVHGVTKESNTSYWLNNKGGKQDGRGVGGHGIHLSPWIHQEYTFRHRSAWRTPADRGQEYLTRGKECIESCKIRFSSVQLCPSVRSDSLRPHESQHARPPSPSPTPGVHSNSCPSSRWCHPAISSSVVTFPSFHQSLPHQGLFQWVNSLHDVAKVLEFQL